MRSRWTRWPTWGCRTTEIYTLSLHDALPICFVHATFGFPGVIALQDISLDIAEGEFVGVIGPNEIGRAHV